MTLQGRAALIESKDFIYAHIRAPVNPEFRDFSNRPAFEPIERRKRVRIWAGPLPGRGSCASWNAAGALHRFTGFRPLECWYELRDSLDGPVSSKTGSPRPVYEWGAQRGTAISKTHLGYTLLKSASPLASSSKSRGGENYAEGGTMPNALQRGGIEPFPLKKKPPAGATGGVWSALCLERYGNSGRNTL
jgi:hypothetical protein